MPFQCMLDSCPKHNSDGGCHLWWEIPWENSETGAIVTNKGCILSQEMGLPIVQTIVRASHMASEHSSVARNAFETGVHKMQATLMYAIEQLPPTRISGEGVEALPVKED